MRRARAALLLLLIWPATTFSQPVQTPAVLLRQAMQQAELPDSSTALDTLDTLIAQDAKADAIQLTARMLRDQLTGAFKSRQSLWLKRQVLDVVVIVPDDAAFAEAISGWTDEQFYPVLPTDAWYTPIFVDAFKPKQIVVWAGQTDGKFDIASLADAHNADLAKRQSPTPPPGLVVIDPAAPSASAGLALAKGRGQPIQLLPVPKPEGSVDFAYVAKLNEHVMTEAARAELLRPGELCGLTLVGRYPLTYQVPNKKGNFAVDDLLGRESRGLRLAVVGRLSPERTQAIYQAMASLFLQPHNALLFDDYSNRGGSFVPYQLATARQVLGKQLEATCVEKQDVNPPNFRKLTRGDKPFDFFWVNSSGSAWHWDLRGRATSDDLPIDHASVFYIVHSFSAQQPWNGDTIAGRMLTGGCYWFFGSVHEPYVSAFVPATPFAHKMAAGTPLAFGARHLPGHPMYQPWKLMLVGDPLYSLRAQPAMRVAPAALPHTTPLALTESADAQQQLREIVLVAPDQALAAAVRCLKNADAMSPDVLARATQIIYQHEGYRALAAVDPKLADRHPISRSLVWQSTLTEFDRQLKEGNLTTAQNHLGQLLAFGINYDMIFGRLTRLHDAAKQAGHGPQLEGWLTEQAKQKLPGNSKRAIDKALASGDGPASGR